MLCAFFSSFYSFFARSTNAKELRRFVDFEKEESANRLWCDLRAVVIPQEKMLLLTKMAVSATAWQEKRKSLAKKCYCDV